MGEISRKSEATARKKEITLGFVNSQVIQGNSGSIYINSRNEIILSKHWPFFLPTVFMPFPSLNWITGN